MFTCVLQRYMFKLSANCMEDAEIVRLIVTILVDG